MGFVRASIGVMLVVILALPVAVRAQAVGGGARDQQVYIYKVQNNSAVDLEEVANLVFSGTGEIGRARTSPVPEQPRRPAPGSSGPPTSAPSGEVIVGQVVVVADPNTNTLLVTTAPANWQGVKDILDILDRPLPKVLVKAVVVRVTRDPTRPDPLAGLIPGGPTTAPTTAPADSASIGVADSGRIATALAELEQSRMLEVLSRPALLLVTGQLGTIKVDRAGVTVGPPHIPAPPRDTPSPAPAGLLVDLVPRLDADGLIRLDIASDSTVPTDASVRVPESVSAPVVQTRTNQASFIVSDNQNIIIAGPAEPSAVPAQWLVFITVRPAPAPVGEQDDLNRR